MENWRLILDRPLSGPVNMAVDEAILRSAQAGLTPSVLRLYGWESPAISIGYMQDPSALAPSGVPVVRRITGGRAVLHGMEVTYSIAAGPASPLFSGGIMGSYLKISGCIKKALEDFGIDASLSRGGTPERGGRDACFHAPSRHELLAGGRKLVGSSQRRFRNAFLQHGSILYDIDEEMNSRIFGEGVVERMACVSSFGGIGMEDLRGSLIKRFSEGLGACFTEGALTEAEAALKEELVSLKYSNPEWNLRAHEQKLKEKQEAAI